MKFYSRSTFINNLACFFPSLFAKVEGYRDVKFWLIYGGYNRLTLLSWFRHFYRNFRRNLTVDAFEHLLGMAFLVTVAVSPFALFFEYWGFFHLAFTILLVGLGVFIFLFFKRIFE